MQIWFSTVKKLNEPAILKFKIEYTSLITRQMKLKHRLKWAWEFYAVLWAGWLLLWDLGLILRNKVLWNSVKMTSYFNLYFSKLLFKMNSLCLLNFMNPDNYNGPSMSNWPTYIDLSPSWKANGRLARQEIANILWNPRLHYCVHNSGPLISILSQFNPVDTTQSYFSKINFHAILPYTSRSHIT